MFGWKFLNGPQLGDPEGILVGNLERAPAGGVRRFVGQKA